MINMGSVKNKKTRNDYAKKYIQAVFADRLRMEGFICPDDKLLCWYRIVNKSLIQSIYFFSRWPNIPLMMEIAYGVYPLFVTPFFFGDVHVSVPINDERFIPMRIIEPGSKQSYALFADDVLVYAPCSGTRGLYTLEQLILTQLNEVQTIEQCYCFHQEKDW